LSQRPLKSNEKKEGNCQKSKLHTENQTATINSTPKSSFWSFQRKNLQRLFITATLLAGVLTTATSASGATRLWNGAAGDTLWSSVGNWSPADAPGASDNVTFANEGISDNPFALGGAVDNVVDAGVVTTSINSLGYMNTNGFHNTQITSLRVIGTSATDVASIADDGQPSVLFVGSNQWQDGKDDSVYATIIGNSLTLSNGNANLGVTQISATAGAHRATLDLTGLNSFTCVVSNVLVGHNFTQPDHAWRPTGELFLAKTNSITTGLIILSDAYQNAGGTCYIHLGSVNTLNADEVRIGMHKCVGFLDITPGLVDPSLTFRNAAGTGRQIAWKLGDEFDANGTNYLFGFFTSNQARGTMDLTGATVDALVDGIILGRGQIQRDATVRNGDGNGTLTFGGGSIDANYIEMGIQVPGPFIGGSVGNGVLNVNNDPGVGPALLTVRSNLVMAVQQPGNTDVNGSTAVITINDGSTLAVAGDIVAGKGHSTINLNNGGELDLKPAGDATPGNVSVGILNITDGIITNFATLSATNINLLGSDQTFTVYPGQVIAPAGVGAIGPLTVSGNLTLRGDALVDISKIGTTLTADLVDATGVVDLGGTLEVTLSGNNNLAVGDRFTLFTAVPVNSSSTVKLPLPGLGLAWTNKILIDGSIEVIASGEPPTPPTITVSNSPTSISLSWPPAYSSFALRGQTNPITVGLSTNWGLVPGVVGNQVTIPINPANGTVFFQLFQQ
jgi:hypothetical protein